MREVRMHETSLKDQHRLATRMGPWGPYQDVGKLASNKHLINCVPTAAGYPHPQTHTHTHTHTHGTWHIWHPILLEKPALGWWQSGLHLPHPTLVTTHGSYHSLPLHMVPTIPYHDTWSLPFLITTHRPYHSLSLHVVPTILYHYTWSLSFPITTRGPYHSLYYHYKWSLPFLITTYIILCFVS